jgi:hypothetical protein
MPLECAMSCEWDVGDSTEPQTLQASILGEVHVPVLDPR